MAGRASQSSSYSSSSSFSYGWTYDVFLSFRGKDTRESFTGNLFNALCERGIHTFFDDQELKGGEEITPTLIKAIEESRIAIPVFSKSYASSSFCLDELVQIIECVKAKGRSVLPVFFGVDPCDVRHQRDSYREAMVKHEERFKDDKEKVQKWREALKQAANLSGKHFIFGNNQYEHEFIKNIVEVVSNKINRAPLHVANYPVGLESPMLEVSSLLNVGLGYDDKVHMVGIHGIGGIGKTTLVRAIYNSIADQFECSCFLENLREKSTKHRLEYLQEMLLSEIVGEKYIKLGSVNKGIQIIKHRLHQKKVLLILDDVDKQQQLQALAGGPDWFGSSSRAIITTRDKHLLASHGVERTYELNGLNEDDARKLLEWNAFKNKEVDLGFVQIINRAVTYATHLPLALEVIGSNLCGKEIEEWKSALDRYERIPQKDIQEILKISFDALEEDVQSVFLDIACCFKGFNLTEVKDILCAHHGVCPKYAIGVLVDKSLIKINYDMVTLHDLIQDMGREIVRQEGRPSERSRLWFPEDIVQVLEDNECISIPCKIEIIFLDLHKSKEVVEWDGKAFKKMKNLKTLIIRNAYFSQGPKHLPNSLKVLEWRGYPSHSLPSDFHPKKVVILQLPGSCFMSLQLVKLLKTFVNMRVLNFEGNRWITQIPDVSGAPNLEKLYFAHCENLIKIDESVGFLGKLRILDVQHCRKLRSFPSLMLHSLEVLCLSHCTSLESFPEILGKMENLRELPLFNTPIKQLPYSICNLTRLQLLAMHHPTTLPSSIFMLQELHVLNLNECRRLLLPNQDEGKEQVSSMLSSNAAYLELEGCNLSDEFLQMFLPRFPNVQVILLSRNNFTILPACIKDCRFLRLLDLKDCKNLQEIRGIPPNIEILRATNSTSMSCSSRRLLLNKKLHEEGGDKTFILPATKIPKWFEHQSSEQSISFWFRDKFPPISVCAILKEKLVDGCDIWPGMKLIINDYNEFQLFHEETLAAPLHLHHIYICDKKQGKFEADVNEVLLKNEWNQAVISLINRKIHEPRELKDLTRIDIGLHIIKERSNMHDIRFTNPLLQIEEHRSMDMGDSHMQHMQQQQTNLASLEPHVGEGTESLSLLPPPALNDNVNWDSNLKQISISTGTVTVQGLQGQQNLTSIDQHKLEGCESVNKAKGKGMVATACNSNVGEDNGKNPLMELLSMTKEATEKYQPASNDKTVAWESWDPMELEYQVTNRGDQLVLNNESTMSDSGCHVMASNRRTTKWQFCSCTLFSSLVSLCSSSSSLDSP